MNKYTATVIRTGNSYALRVPKSYIDNASLKLGQKVQVSPPMVASVEYSAQAVKNAVQALQATRAFSGIVDPVVWQREVRQDRALPGRK